MYGFLLRPDTLPKAYISWIDQAGQIPIKGVAMNRDLVREGRLKVSDIDQLLTNPVRSPQSTAVRTSILTLLMLGTSPEEPNLVVDPPGNGNRIPAELW